MNDVLRKLKKLFVLATRSSAWSALARYGVAASVEHDPVLREPIKTVIDIGANRGQFSLAVRHFHPAARIVAFEPLPSASAVYRKVFAQDPQNTLYSVAISPQAGEIAMHVAQREDSSSLLPITARQTEMVPDVVAIEQIKVSAGPLSRYISEQELSEPVLLKIDVQGFEKEVLAACETHFSRIDRIYVEASFITLYEGQALAPEIIEYLQKRGFALREVFNTTHDPATGEKVQADFLFARR